jgi:hypothetical protein
MIPPRNREIIAAMMTDAPHRATRYVPARYQAVMIAAAFLTLVTLSATPIRWGLKRT